YGNEHPVPMDLFHVLPRPHGRGSAGIIPAESIRTVPRFPVSAILPDSDLYLRILCAVEPNSAAKSVFCPPETRQHGRIGPLSDPAERTLSGSWKAHVGALDGTCSEPPGSGLPTAFADSPGAFSLARHFETGRYLQFA